MKIMMTSSFSVKPASASTAQSGAGRLLLLAWTLLAITATTGCASKKNDNPYARPKSYARPYRDPVEQRIFYQGWRHPS